MKKDMILDKNYELDGDEATLNAINQIRDDETDEFMSAFWRLLHENCVWFDD